jgi:hypothetical protein
MVYNEQDIKVIINFESKQQNYFKDEIETECGDDK